MTFNEIRSNNSAYSFWPGGEPTESFIDEVNDAEALLRKHCEKLGIEISTINVKSSIRGIASLEPVAKISININGVSGVVNVENTAYDPSPEDVLVIFLCENYQDLKSRNLYVAIFDPDEDEIYEEDQPFVILSTKSAAENARMNGVYSYRLLNESVYRYAE